MCLIFSKNKNIRKYTPLFVGEIISYLYDYAKIMVWLFHNFANDEFLFFILFMHA